MKHIITSVKDALKGKPLALRSPKWHGVRDAYLHTHNTCASCGATKNLQVHHIEPFHLFPEKELEPTNFITLCEEKGEAGCHLKSGHLGNWKTNNANVVKDAQDKLDTIHRVRQII